MGYGGIHDHSIPNRIILIQNLQFADRDSDELEDDEKFVKTNEHDWKDSAVLHIHDCRILEVSYLFCSSQPLFSVILNSSFRYHS